MASSGDLSSKPPAAIVLSGDLRLTCGVLRSPFATSKFARIGETAKSPSGRAAGWVEAALINGSTQARTGPADRIEKLVADIRRSRVGGDFWASAQAFSSGGAKLVLKVGRQACLRQALAVASERASAEEIGVWLPSAAWSKRAGAALDKRGFSVWIGAADPWVVLDRTAAVAVAGDDDFGLLALLAGRKVLIWSPGLLGGWGLTEDHAAISRRGDRDLLQLAGAALVDGVRYTDPFTGRPTDCETIVGYLADWRRIVDQDRGMACLAGIAWWKRKRMRQFFAPGANRAPFLETAEACVARAKAEGGAIGVWPSRAPAGLAERARDASVSLRRIEDGFVRSVGLGSDLLPPSSIVVDRVGIYYDPRTPSDLETILAETAFSPELQERALALVERLRKLGMTKYNLGGGPFTRPSAARVVLVPGQVEDDQSVLLSGVGCTGNLDLLRRVREQEPDAYIIYKPHPDVEAGNRVGAILDGEARRYADHIERDAAMKALLDGVDALHVLTSLAGFEALLRGREVVVHGRPFYCGWGLTRDLSPPPRRGRGLNLAELVAGTLILYPRYLDPVGGLLCPPEILVDRLAKAHARPPAHTARLRWLRRRFEGVRKPATGIDSGPSMENS